ncbi:MAG TPA: CinA family nicotinamide mononucleotide deamidase-related protein [Pseudomonadales bacterium]
MKNMAPDSPLAEIGLLMTGHELMTGDTIDSNSAWLGQVLSDAGLAITEKVTLGDDHDALVNHLHRLTRSHRLLLINGGLGPTQDDLTASALATVAGQPLIVNEAARQHVVRWCEKRGFSANPANLKQALLPQTACIFPDAPGSAPAFYLTINNCLVIATPGVPGELKTITRQQLLPFLRKHHPLPVMQAWQRHQLFGIGESSLQQLINNDYAAINHDYDVGFRVNFPYLELKLKQRPAPSPQAQDHLNNLLNRLADYRIGDGGETMARQLVDLLRQRHETIATAESCTGGRIASDITAVSGASAVFPGAIVSYANSSKSRLLGVSETTLQHFGAVSEETVKAMLDGVFRQFACNYGVAVSGIAGPDGGSAEKPAGTVWISWGSRDKRHCTCLLLPLERLAFQQMVSTICLDLVRREAQQMAPPDYLSRWAKAG